MRFRLVVLFVCVLALTAACQDTQPTLMVLVLTPTPEDAATPEVNGSPVIGARSTASITPAATVPDVTQTPAPTPTLDPFPTPVINQIQVAEQPFEHGRMFWIQPQSEIWVAIEIDEDRGRWEIYEDTFEEGQPEMDPGIVPPSENLYQPERGFGKLWRENEDVREALGWAVTPMEFGYISPYEYHAGGVVNGQATYIPAAGYHILFSLYEELYRFNEADQTWQLGRGD